MKNYRPLDGSQKKCAHTFFTSLSGCGLVQMDEKGLDHWMVVI
jgi:hypothetical protein